MQGLPGPRAFAHEEIHQFASAEWRPDSIRRRKFGGPPIVNKSSPSRQSKPATSCQQNDTKPDAPGHIRFCKSRHQNRSGVEGESLRGPVSSTCSPRVCRGFLLAVIGVVRRNPRKFRHAQIQPGQVDSMVSGNTCFTMHCQMMAWSIQCNH